jgi:ABC-type phosphate transport system auxiliary subunit
MNLINQEAEVKEQQITDVLEEQRQQIEDQLNEEFQDEMNERRTEIEAESALSLVQPLDSPFFDLMRSQILCTSPRQCWAIG